MGSHTAIKKLGTRRYRRVSSRLDKALVSGKFDQAAEYGASLAAVASSTDTLAILASAAQAYKEGKAKDWKPSSEEIAKAGIKRAAEISKLKLTSRRKKIVEAAISEAAEKRKAKG